MIMNLTENKHMAAETRSDEAFRLVHGTGEHGVTWKELDELTGWNHHGKTTGALSKLHQAGKIFRLPLTRQKCSVYVAPEFVGDRETIPYGPRKTAKVNTTEYEILEQRATELFEALDHLSYAKAFARHHHVWIEEEKTCSLCAARKVIAKEAELRHNGKGKYKPLTTRQKMLQTMAKTTPAIDIKPTS